MSRVRVLPLALVLLSACGPDVPPPVKVMALTLDEDGVYAPRQVELRTILDVVGMRGTAATLKGGVKIVLDEEELAAYEQAAGAEGLTVEDFQKLVLKRVGTPVHASFVDQGGVLWPTDFHTWNLVSTYYNFERAFEYFHASSEIPLETLKGADVYYYPEVEWPGLETSDNAYWLSPLQSFLLVGFEEAQDVPFPMNPGIVAHEYAHQVFNRLVYSGEAFPYPLVSWGPPFLGASGTPSVNLLKAMDEGFADYHAVEASCDAKGCDTRFLEPSLGKAHTDARDVAGPHCLTEALANDYFTLPDQMFLEKGAQYSLGTVFASALHTAATRTGQRQALSRALLASYSDPDPDNPGFAQLIAANQQTPDGFHAGRVFNAFVKHVADVELRNELCGQLMDRLGFALEDLPACPGSAQFTEPVCRTEEAAQ